MDYQEWETIVLPVSPSSTVAGTIETLKPDLWIDVEVNFDDIADNMRSYELIGVTGADLPFRLVSLLAEQFKGSSGTHLPSSMAKVLDALSVGRTYRLWLRCYLVGEEYIYRQIGCKPYPVEHVT